MFGLSGVVISIKSIDRHIGHGSSVGVCFVKRVQIYRIGKSAIHEGSFLSIPR